MLQFPIPYEIKEALLFLEIWKIWTPTFVHFGFFHLVFNLMWVGILGGPIEKIQGSQTLLLLYLVSGAISNYLQFFHSGPFFGGMSGVCYALLGYVWMQSRINPIFYGKVVPKLAIYAMLIWFFACWLGLVPNVANIAHTGGLVVGIIWGRSDAKRLNKQFKSYTR